MSLVPGAGGAAARPRPPSDDPVALKIGGTAWAGWQSLRITRGCERMPSTFELAVTERYADAGLIDIKPGQPCQVLIGGDLVITGYVDDYGPEYDKRNHMVRIAGRSKSEDLVDCSAILPYMQISGVSALALANTLCAPYGITASQIGTAGNAVLPKFNVTLGETVYEILERVARYSQFLLYDGTDGNIILAQIGTVKAASGFVEGVNVERVRGRFSMAERYSKYIASVMSTATLADLGTGGWQKGEIDDPTVPRFRQLIIVSEQVINGQSLALQRAKWEMARRLGRSQAVTVTCDSWRDSAGTLWAPNTLAEVTLPRCKLVDREWVIGDVGYIKDDDGTHAEIMLMPPEAFMPAPDPLVPFDWQTQQAIADANKGSAK